MEYTSPGSFRAVRKYVGIQNRKANNPYVYSQPVVKYAVNQIPSTKKVIDKPKKNGQCGPMVILGYLSLLYQNPFKFPNRTTLDATVYPVASDGTFTIADIF